MDDPAGELARGQSVATALQNFFTFFCYFTPIIGALVADQYIGRYWTIIIFSIIYMFGWLILTATSVPTALASGAGFPGYIVALIVIGCEFYFTFEKKSTCPVPYLLFFLISRYRWY